MRSLATTFILALTAALLCMLAAWQWRQGNFDSFFGSPPTPVGERLYSSFSPDAVKFIGISNGDTLATFSLQKNGWQASTPWTDRMDPRAAATLIDFTLGMRVVDVAREHEIDPTKAGLAESAIRIRLENADHTPLAIYKLGRLTPWKAELPDMDQPAPTLFIQPREKNHKHHIYACTGDITPLFKDSFKFLRDHRPFFFNPTSLKKLRIRSQQGDLTLGRESPQSPWRIIQPLDLPTDPAAIKSLLQGIFDLQALKVSDRASVTLPTNDTTVKNSQIALTPFGTETETLLEILPPENAKATLAKATVSDRPDTVFELPIKPEPGIISLADLPLSVNELRDPFLTRLNIQTLRGITIQSASGPQILISRTPPQPWTLTIDGTSSEANEENLYELLKAVTTTRVIGFESDAATDFTPWGLTHPILTLRFLGQDNLALTLRFGIDPKGNYFVNRLGTPIVMRVDPSIIPTIAVRPYEWRHARLWSVNRVNLLAIKLQQASNAPLTLKYKYKDELWEAESNGRKLSATLDPARANFLLSVLEGLKVTRWLSPTDEGALAALSSPSLTLTVFEKSEDDQMNLTGFAERTVSFAPATQGSNPGFYYGRLSTESHPFLLNRDTYQKLTTGLFEN